MNRNLGITILLVVLINYCYSQTHCFIKPSTKRIIDSTYNKLLKQTGTIGFSLAIVDSGRIVYSCGYGFSDKNNNVKATDETIYRIGSISKSFTVLSLFQLSEAGKVSIEEGLKKYIPEFDIRNRFNDSNVFKIRDVMSHTSGLPSDILNGFFCTNPPKQTWVTEQLKNMYSISKANYKHAYSNIGYGLLGQVISNVSKLSYDEYLRTNIFKPLKMKSSFVDYDSVLIKKFSKGYLDKKETYEPLIRDAAAGLVHSNVLDMGNYLNMYLAKDHKIITNASIIEMEKKQLSITTLSRTEAWGLGLYSQSYFNEKDSSRITITGHGGDTYLYHADMAFINSLNVGAVILTNSNSGTALNNAANLIQSYLKSEKGIKIKADNKDTAMIQNNEDKLNENEIFGTYFINNIKLDVKKINKIKARQGPVSLLFYKSKKNKDFYKLKALLLGVIPIKVKNQEFAFCKIDNQVYFKAILTKRKRFNYVAVKTEMKIPPNGWIKSAGDYAITENKYKCEKCPFGNFENLKMNLAIKDNLIFFSLKMKDKSQNQETIILPIDETTAVTPGIGRNTGETIYLMPNGNVYYSGFEFVKLTQITR